MRDRLFAEAQAIKREEMKTYNVRILKRHRGVDGVHMDVSLNLEDLAPPGKFSSSACDVSVFF